MPFLPLALSDTTETVGIAGIVIVLMVAPVMVSNIGFRPRIQGQYLEVSTLLGRQSLDLAALTSARWEPGRSGGASGVVRLRDSITDVAIAVPAAQSVRAAIREGLRAAGERGVLLPRRVTGVFGLPPMPGAPRNGFNTMILVLGFLAGLFFVGLAAGFLATT
ncbi:hypothetical protein [Kribbella speibonae]|uniref:ABC transporter permease n=1 Tax=Kribbella speibonae TaxID=1572660 RepID=A0ABY2ACT7_9ACTN|nr:hypothetical protein [Kribbella speibonae]TCC26893.1 hypothetical protein E0H58_02470 [Kribbella speibonae]